MAESPPVAPREAATVILLREPPGAGVELLMIARNPKGRVMGGVWAFPGGAVECDDGDGEQGLRAAAVRELAEEVAIEGVGAEELIPFSRWIAPVSLPYRFDTHFFLARAPAGAVAVADGVECVDARWLRAEAALAAGRAGELPLMFPTRKQLERIGPHATIEALFAHAAMTPVVPVRPRLRRHGDPGDPLLPGEPGYETATG